MSVEHVGPAQRVGDGDGVGRLTLAVEGLDRLVDVPVGRLVEVGGVDVLLDCSRDRIARKQHRSEERLLGLEVVGRNPPHLARRRADSIVWTTASPTSALLVIGSRAGAMPCSMREWECAPPGLWIGSPKTPVSPGDLGPSCPQGWGWDQTGAGGRSARTLAPQRTRDECDTHGCGRRWSRHQFNHRGVTLMRGAGASSTDNSELTDRIGTGPDRW